MTLNDVCSEVLAGKTVSLIYKKGQIILPITKENILHISNEDSVVKEIKLKEGTLDTEWFKITETGWGMSYKIYDNYEYELKLID